MRSTRGGYLPSANLEQTMGFLTTEQLAVHLGVSTRQIQRLTTLGLPSIPVGARSRRYDPEACVAWLQVNGEALNGKAHRPQLASSRLSEAAAVAYSEQYRKARLRVMPSHPKSG